MVSDTRQTSSSTARQIPQIRMYVCMCVCVCVCVCVLCVCVCVCVRVCVGGACTIAHRYVYIIHVHTYNVYMYGGALLLKLMVHTMIKLHVAVIDDLFHCAGLHSIHMSTHNVSIKQFYLVRQGSGHSEYLAR